MLFLWLASMGFAATPPAQPRTGPGGTAYVHKKVTKNVYGAGADQYWLYEPSEPAPTSAPVIVFLHGWGATNPRSYGGWIDHLVRRGHIVIYPRYQEQWRYPPGQIATNAARAVASAIQRLKDGTHVAPELDKVAYVGHSAGGQTAANLAAMAGKAGIPLPRAVMCVQPGKSWGKVEKIRIPLVALSNMPAGVLLLTVVGDKDTIAGDTDAKRIFNETPQISLTNKNYITLVSDDHGEPPLVANHFAPCALNSDYNSGETPEGPEAGLPFFARLREKFSRSDRDDLPSLEGKSRPPNALDYYGIWKLFDGLCAAAFYGKDRQYALGNTAEQRTMGKWSDGVAVKELKVTAKP